MADGSSPAPGAGRSAYLLPNYDEYVVAYADRSTICDPVMAKSAGSRGNLLFNHTIVLDGRIAGTSRRSIAKSGVTIEARVFAQMNTAQARKVAKAAERYGAFLGVEARVSY